jgi:hypothetical protein
MRFKKDLLVEILGLPDNAIEDIIIDHTRWTVVHRIIFAYQDKFYETNYHVGATELQGMEIWEYDNEIDCVEVQKQEVVVTQWVEVKKS